MDSDKKINDLRTLLRHLYQDNQERLLFHGWHHINFVSKKAKEFSKSIGANTFIVETAALVHDLNYIVEINSEPEAGSELRASMLKKSNYTDEEIMQIENVIIESHLANRGADGSKEMQALADADTLFKALPITPILFASKYIEQNKVNIKKLSQKVILEQKPLIEQDLYFYTDIAKQKYLHWAKVNLNLWINVEEALEDDDIQEVISIAQDNNIL